MKKIITKNQQERNMKTNQLIMGFILIGLMIFSTVGYALNGNNSKSSNNLKYNNIEFIENSGYWFFNVNGREFSTLYNPSQLESLSISTDVFLNNYIDKPLYFVGTSDYFSEIFRNLNPIVLRIQNACLSEENCLNDLPMKDCTLDNIIIIREPLNGETESIYQKDNCVYIVSNIENQIKYIDYFLFKILGI